MLETYFESPKMVAYLRAGPSGPYMDGFAAWLERSGYEPSVAVRYLRAAAHIGHFTWNKVEHWPTWICWPSHAICEPAVVRGQKAGAATTIRFTAPGVTDEYLVAIGVGQCGAAPESENADPVIIIEYRRWLRKHRGAAESTIRLYSRDAADLLTALGDDPGRWDAKGVRDHFLDRASKCGAGTAEKLTTGLRAFLRYLSARGQCRADLDQAVPTFASWRLARLPRYLTAEQIDSLIAACDGSSPARRRDRAIILAPGTARASSRRCRGASHRRYRVGGRHAAGLREGALPGSIAPPAGRWRRDPGLPRVSGSHPGVRPYLRSKHCTVPAVHDEAMAYPPR